MLESLSIPHYSPQKGSDNMLGADNQQERLRTVGWIVGFVDGEGCFSVTIQKATTTTGWQVFPEFVVTQGAKSLQALHDLKEFFECGKVFINRRNDNHKKPLYPLLCSFACGSEREDHSVLSRESTQNSQA